MCIGRLCAVRAWLPAAAVMLAGLAGGLAAGCATGQGGIVRGGAQGAGGGAVPAGMVIAEGLPGELTDEIDQVLHSVIVARGLRPIEPVTARGVSRDEQIAFVKAETDKTENTRPLRLVESLLRAMGSIGNDVDLVKVVGDFMVNDVAGYYDWDRKALFVGDWGEPALLQEVLAHELTHALQDQHFGLARLAEPVDGISEPFGAGMALVEGDATLAMLFVGAGAAPMDPAVFPMLAQMMDSAWDDEYAAAAHPLPPVVSELLKFPYVEGVRYVGRLIAADGGGWASVDAALQTPPLSCEQVMHPGKPGEPDLPRNVRLAQDTVAGGVFSGTEIVGESGFQAIFRDVMPRADADAAAAGWDGDRYAVWSMPDGGSVLVLVSVWDSADDALVAGMAMSRLRGAPAGLAVRDAAVAAVWGLDQAGALKLASGLAAGPDTVEIASWDDWLAEGRLIGGGDVN